MWRPGLRLSVVGSGFKRRSGWGRRPEDNETVCIVAMKSVEPFPHGGGCGDGAVGIAAAVIFAEESLQWWRNMEC
jgi:hypothetical protein